MKAKSIVSMDRNTSPIVPLSEEQIIKATKNTLINLYPDKELQRFKRLYATRNNFDPELIELANGSDEWLQKFIFTFGEKGVMSLNPDFVMYQVYTEQVAVPFYQVDCKPDFSFDFNEISKQISEKEPSLFLISNPHNPTGKLFKEEEIEQLADAMAKVGGYLVIDEAYVEFSSDYQRPSGEHVIIVRTLSKIYGLAGLRIGVAVAEGETFEKITRFNHPYPVNSLSLNLANELFSNETQLEELIHYQLESKRLLEKSLQKVRHLIHVNPSSTNYLFTYGEKAVSLADFLLKKGFQARQYREPLLANAVRYSIIPLENYEELEQAIRDWSEQVD